MNKEELRSAAKGRHRDIAVSLGIPESILDGRHHECPQCGGTDRFRAFNDFSETGGVFCNQCHSSDNSDIFSTVQWMRGRGFSDALKYVADFVGYSNGQSGKGAAQRPCIMERVSRAKKIPLDAMRSYGAEAAKRGNREVVRFPVFNKHAEQHSYFDLIEMGKGWFKKGKGSSGVFLPLDGPPKPGERWFVVEGPKDACALYSLGFKTCGTPSDYLPQEYVGLFSGCDVVIVPDRTTDAENKAEGSARRLDGVASSVCIVKLPLEIAQDSSDPNDVRDVLAKRNGEQLLRDAIDQSAEWHPTNSSDEIPGLETAEGQTDTANAQRLITLHGIDLRYVGPWDRWLLFDGKRWHLDESRKVEVLAKDVGRNLFREADRNTTAAGRRWATKSCNIAGIRNMIAAASGELAVHHETLNNHSMLLNVENGTIDLRTGKLRIHNRDDLLTQIAPVDFDPNAECPLGSKFLRETMDNNSRLIGFLRRLVGYTLTGEIRQHILPILYGSGSNGKSVFIGTIQRLLGKDYATQAPPDLLMAASHDRHPTELADLFGRRLVATVETERGQRINEPLVKQLTGGDTIKARRMRENFWEFLPTHKVWMATNHKPDVRGTDDGIWRRLKLVPFLVTIPDDQQDHELPRKLQSELSGILNWALVGCQEWLTDGLREPTEVIEATADYRTEADYIGQFIDDRCVVGQGFQVGATELHKAFQDWGGRLNQTRFGREIDARTEFTRGRLPSGRKCYIGLGLRTTITED